MNKPAGFTPMSTDFQLTDFSGKVSLNFECKIGNFAVNLYASQ